MWSVYTRNKITMYESAESGEEDITSADVIDFDSGKKIKFNIKESDGENINNLPHTVVYMFPFIIKNNGETWFLASSYIYEKIPYESPFGDGFHNLALDLADYKNYLDEVSGLEFDTFPLNEKKRVTYRYKAHIKQKVHTGDLELTTANRRLNSVSGFYSWLMDKEIMEFENPPFNQKTMNIQFQDSVGRNRSKKVVSTDLQTKIPKSNDPYDDTYIDDEGKLRPLPEQEQKLVLDALHELDCIEMSLIFLFALFTGARLQTVLTLRVEHVQLSIDEDINVVPLLAGYNTRIDTKNSKKHVLYVPRWLYEKLRIYSQSEQRETRVERAHDYAKDYLFLTNRGSPYYIAKEDKREYCEATQLNHFKKGGTVDTFLNKSILPKIEKLHGKKIKFRFHDLRASFGLNHANVQNKLVAEGKITQDEACKHVMQLMGHNDYRTTMLYIKYEHKIEHVIQATKEYEAYLIELSNDAMKLV